MRTTLDIEDDVLQAAKELARAEGTTVGRLVSTIVRKYIIGSGKSEKKYIFKNGVPMLPPREGELITMEHVQRLLDEEGL